MNGNWIIRAVGLICVPAVCLSWSAPKIAFDITEYSFGNIKQGDKAGYNFEFRNEGDDTLKVENVRSSCGCTAAMLTKKIVPPGEGGKISASFNSKGFNGKIHKTVTVTSNDPKNPRITLHMRGAVTVDLTIEPKNLYVQLTKGVTPVIKKVTIKNHSRRPMKVIKVTTTSPVVKAKLKPLAIPVTIKPRKDYQIEFEISPVDAEPSWKRLGDINIQTTSRINGNVNIPVFLSGPK